MPALSLNILAGEPQKALGGKRYVTGIAAFDDALGGGLKHGKVHEIYAANPDDAVSAAGFTAMMAMGVSNSKSLIWLRTKRAVRAGGMIYAPGLLESGGTPENWLLVLAEDNKALLRAAVDAARCDGLGAVIIEAWGRMPEMDLTASRRMALAAEKSGVTLFLLRTDGEVVPSAAETRWSVASAPSRALAANAPGAPVFDIELLRRRSGPSGMRWRLEWDRDRREFGQAAISGAVVPVPVRRPAAESGTGPLRYAA